MSCRCRSLQAAAGLFFSPRHGQRGDREAGALHPLRRLRAAGGGGGGGGGKLAGACINPGTPVSALERLLPELDQVIVMSVNPGWSGQQFIEGSLAKVRRLREMIDESGLGTEIEVDGGVTVENAPVCAAAGANSLVAASAVFNDSGSVAENMARLKEA